MTTIYAREIPEFVLDGLRLGRHVEVDDRSRDYAYTVPGKLRAQPLQPVRHQRLIPILDQGSTSACTGNAAEGAAGTTPVYQAIPATCAGRPDPANAAGDESQALGLYSHATELDSIPGTYPPTDTGSTGLAVAKAMVQAGLISGYQHAFTFTDAVGALQLTPLMFGINWYECIPADQRVLTSDLRWVPIQKIQVGDELIGFDEQLGVTARYRRSRVTDMGIKHRPVYEIVTSRGTVAASGGHLFVRCDPKKGHSWIRADQVQPGDRLAYFLDPFEEDTSWEAGWLSGFFDGEGTLAGSSQLNFGQAVGPILDKARHLLEAKGFDATIKQVRPAGTDGRGIVSRKELANVYVTGDYHGALRFLGQMRPERLLKDAARLWEGKALKSRRGSPVEVQSVKLLGVEEVHSIGTTTRTLVVEGLLSHNSFDMPDAGGLVSITKGAQVRGGHEILATELVADQQLIGFDNSWSASWGLEGRCYMSFADVERLLAEQGDVIIPVPLSQPAPAPVQPAKPAQPGQPAPGSVLTPVEELERQMWSMFKSWARLHGFE